MAGAEVAGAVVIAACPSGPTEGAAGLVDVFVNRLGVVAIKNEFPPPSAAGFERAAASPGAPASTRFFLGWAAEAVVEKRPSALVVLEGGAPAGVVDPSPPKRGFAGVDCRPEAAGAPRPPNNGFVLAWDVPVAAAPNNPVPGAALVVVGAAVLSPNPKLEVAAGAVVGPKSEVPAGFWLNEPPPVDAVELPNNPPDVGVTAAPGVDVALAPNENEGLALAPAAVLNNPLVAGAVDVVAGFEAPLETPPRGVPLKLKDILRDVARLFVAAWQCDLGLRLQSEADQWPIPI